MAKMPMSGLKAVEFIEEVTFGTTPENSNWSWIGLVDKYDTPIKKDTESFKHLPDPDDTTGLSKKRTQVVGGTLEASLSYFVQDFAFWKYAMGNATTLGNTLTPISIAETLEEPDATKKFIVAKGNAVKSIKLSLSVDGVGKCDTSLQRADIAAPSATDPTGSGDWEDEDASVALLWEDISDMCMDANAVPTTAIGHIIGDVSVEIANEMDFPKDVDETTWTKIAGIVLNSRDINLGLRLTYVDVNDTAVPKIHDLISNSTLQNLRFTLGDRIFIIKNLLFTEWNPAAAPEEYLGEELTPETDNADFILAYKMGYAYADDGDSFTNDTVAANNSTINDMTLLPAAPVENDAYYFGRADETFSTLQLNLGTAGDGEWTILWEYYDSIAVAWATCIDIVDGTTGFEAAAGWHDVTHTIQTGAVKNWGKTTVNSIEAYWIRARVSAYTSIVTQPKGTQAWVYGEVSEVAT
jgi:hypothetical protein